VSKKEGGGGGGGNAAFVLFALLALGLAGASVWLRGQATKEAEKLDRVKREYREMADRLRRPVEQYLKSRRAGGEARASAEDAGLFLSRKAAQAEIPAGLFALQKNQDFKTGSWKEQTYTVNLRGTKDAPLARGPIVNFLRLVETERPAIRTKGLNLAFAGDPLSSATLTFAFFELEK
jgi:hypothetical protein